MTIFNNEIIQEVQHEFDDLLNFVLLDTRSSRAYEVERGVYQEIVGLAWGACHQGRAIG